MGLIRKTEAVQAFDCFQFPWKTSEALVIAAARNGIDIATLLETDTSTTPWEPYDEVARSYMSEAMNRPMQKDNLASGSPIVTIKHASDPDSEPAVKMVTQPELEERCRSDLRKAGTGKSNLQKATSRISNSPEHGLKKGAKRMYKKKLVLISSEPTSGC